MPNAKSVRRKITMRDVARYAGVSQSTVSRVLSQNFSDIAISDETMRKVQEAVKNLGYYPNVTAQSLRTQRTHMIALMIADISNPFYHYLARTIQDIAVRHNYDVIISNTDHIYEYEMRVYDALMRRPVDGMILVPYHLTDEHLDTLIKRTGAAITALAGHIEHPAVDVVSADDEAATYHAVDWLIRTKGHQRIGFIGASPSFSVSTRRQRGYTRAMQDTNLNIRPEWIQEGNFTHESGYNTMQRLLTAVECPTAVFACNDIMAIGAMNAALDRGLCVPENIAIIGFDDVPAATLVRPQLTTVAQFPVELGTHLAESLFERIEGRMEGKGRSFTVPCELIIRQST
jgi:LacI family transcriptional regulator